ncbi:MAG: porin family protein, partial [Rhizobiaceae bacterium]|nr:porin family protein [Rhizobiaceae bacterium]
VVEVVDVVAAPQWNWSGAYIGLHGGYGFSSGDSNYNDPPTGPCGPGGFISYGCAVDLDPDGAFGGVQAGYNYVFDNGVMLGIEGDYSWASMTDDGLGAFTWFGDPSYTHVDMKIDQMATIQARLGYAMGRWLPFATLGWGWAHVERSAYNPDTLPTPTNDERWHDGWTAGVGAEYAIDDNWSLKGEYRYFDAGDEDYSLGFADGTNVDLQIHTLRVGVNYRF